MRQLIRSSGEAPPARPGVSVALIAVLVVIAALFYAGHWAGERNAQRDAGVTWLWAVSPRSMQSYLVRAKVDPVAETVSFTLEGAGQTYQFRDCVPSPDDESPTRCRDQHDNTWDISTD